jgi:hypothetical protein
LARPLGADGLSKANFAEGLSRRLKIGTAMALVPINFRAPNCGAHGACSRKFLTAKLRCGLPDIACDRPSAGMISDYCDFTMSSTFSATGQLLDVKRTGDRELARATKAVRAIGSSRVLACTGSTASAAVAPTPIRRPGLSDMAVLPPSRAACFSLWTPIYSVLPRTPSIWKLARR